MEIQTNVQSVYEKTLTKIKDYSLNYWNIKGETYNFSSRK